MKDLAKEQLMDIYDGADMAFDDEGVEYQDRERYTDFSPLGQGAIKEVKKCYDLATKRFVAYATVREDIDRNFNDYFLHEAWLTASLKHPNIIKVHDIGEDAETGCSYFTMDLKANRTLKDVVAEGAGLRELLSIYSLICNAMAYAHSEKVLHLDLKPDNIQCDRFGEVLVCDWGLWKSLTHEGEERDFDRVETLMGEVKGSLGYLAPEQVTGVGEKCALTDIFSLGCILYFILAGEAPYVGDKKVVLHRTASEELKPFRHRYPDRNIPRALEAVVIKAMSREPNERYASVDELLEELHCYFDRGVTIAERPTVWRRLVLLLSRHMQMTVAVVVFTFLVGLLSMGGYILINEGEKKRQEVATALDEVQGDYDDISSQLGVIEEALPEVDSVVDGMIREADRRINLSFLGEVQRDMKRIQEAMWLYEQAYKIDPTSVDARRHLISNYFFLLDFDALSNFEPIEKDIDSVKCFLKFANRYPNISYTFRERPSINQLQQVVELMYQQDYIDPVWVQLVLLRDFCLRGSKDDLNSILLVLLKEYNQGQLGDVQFYDPVTKMLEFDVEGVVKNPYWYGKFSLFQYFNLTSLKLNGEVFVQYLGEMHIEVLDLSDCKILSTKGSPVKIRGLRKLIVSEEHLSWAKSAVFINSEKVEIVTG